MMARLTWPSGAPSTNVWYAKKSTGGTFAFTWGVSGDQPLIGDFDGDGKADPTELWRLVGLQVHRRRAEGELGRQRRCAAVRRRQWRPQERLQHLTREFRDLLYAVHQRRLLHGRLGRTRRQGDWPRARQLSQHASIPGAAGQCGTRFFPVPSAATLGIITESSMRWFLHGLLAGVVTLGGMYRAEAAQRPPR